jgi:hypothetical protein
VPIVDAGPVHRRMVVIRRNDVGPPGGIAQAFLDLLLEMVGGGPLVGPTNGTAAHVESATGGTVIAVGLRRPGLPSD